MSNLKVYFVLYVVISAVFGSWVLSRRIDALGLDLVLSETPLYICMWLGGLCYFGILGTLADLMEQRL